MNKVLSYLFISLLTTSCVNQDHYQRIDSFLAKKNISLNNYKQLVAINTLGDCISCNNTFSLEMSSYLKQNNILFIVSSTGSRIDISPYLSKESSNIILDFKKEFNKLNIINHSAILKFKDNKIDTIIEFDLKNISSCSSSLSE